ncbi:MULTISPECIES: hypothetical protein [unclassified Tolypothrix]|uniref:hypothetical protein n=1 Tax=unclassified Tolypothrix TaxID=2649714 RepID=UPI0005EAC0B7|nr:MULTISPECIES: hypothetical protein [unclassified Tolypothrix]BAY92883.1 hypothetical protein NIES3275_49200 [Microchaete diplosiphon NIES-3275]EKF02983.1 hypothetical protein FDUTEX481_05786 [Tolypothrix sp. PCC 7601]MBE9083324.1 hypothetical protein [Tolypothrix sp. LEGE 11397]UYD26794.1 hypothetical protein HGR01_01355 [Tolypothrix sp. PCC 7712]UYD37349.1 hypothetical protein HG267_17460 [Tolypothrix sp. PCC 7601]
MKSRDVWLGLTGLTVGLILVNSAIAPPALAGRYVLNQTPQTIERYFGRYITKKTNGEQVTYTYAPKSFRQLFKQFPKSDFSITFVKSQAKYITLNFNGDFFQYPGSYNYDKAEATKFYNYIFGYQPPIWKELSAKFSGNETIYFYEYCLGDGVATNFERYGYKQFTDSATLSYNNRCEPPYNLNEN